MTIIGSQAQAARNLVQWPREYVARKADLSGEDLLAFETGAGTLDADAIMRLQKVLEAGGAVFLPEDADGGVGVRLKFTAKDVRALDRMENEGGAYGSDDV